MEQFIQDIARGAGQILKEKFKQVGVKYTKSDATDVVTEADLLSNTFLVNAIKEKYPDHGIISEETGEENTTAQYQWIIDPLDGTFNFATGTPLFGVIVALAKNGVIELGAIYEPLQDELFYAKRGEGAFLNGQKISCSQKIDISQSSGALAARLTPEKFPVVKKVVEMSEHDVVWVSAWGCAALGSSFTAVGRRDWYLNPGCAIWDFAGGSVILSESGCKVTNLQGEPWTLKDKTMLAANPILHEKIFQFLQK